VEHIKEVNVCSHRVMGDRKKLVYFVLLFLHSKKVFDGRCAKCSRCGKWIRPSKALTRAQGVLTGIFITLGLGFIFGGEYTFYFFVFETIPLAIILNTIRTILLIFMRWDDDDDLSDRYKYEEFLRGKRATFIGGVSIGVSIGALVLFTTDILISICTR